MITSRKISARVWDDEKFCALSVERKLEVLYLISNNFIISEFKRYAGPAFRSSAPQSRRIKQLSSADRLAVLKYDDFTCQYCGAKPAALECDHILPRSRGGDNSFDNLITSCPSCNRAKGTKTLHEWLGGGNG